MRYLGYLIGIRRVKTDDPNVLLIKFPSWIKGSTVDKIVANLTADAKVSGTPIKTERGHRVVRIEKVV